MSPRPSATLLAGVLAALALAPCVAEAEPASASAASALPRNFHAIDGTLYRGGKIESAEQLRLLHDRYGVTTVVCLAKDSLGQAPDNEFTWAPPLGVTIVKAYLTDVPPTPAQWRDIKAAMVAGHAYVHCKWGADRTGMVVARYREEAQGWEPARAFAEARHYGFKPWLKAMRAWLGAEASTSAQSR